MIDEIIKGIAKGLYDEFGESGYSIYTERVEQGLNVPCFFVLCERLTDRLYRGKRYRLSAEIKVEFVADEKADCINGNINSVLEKMYDLTEIIDVDDCVLRGLETGVEKNENGFVFNVKYEYFYYKTDDVEDMEVLEGEMITVSSGQ